MKKNLKLLGISFAGGLAIAGIAAIIQALIVKGEISSVTKFISNCTFFSTAAYVLCMMYVVLQKNNVITNLKYINMVKKAQKEGAKPPYRSLEEYQASVPQSSFQAFVFWFPMIVFFILTVIWM